MRQSVKVVELLILTFVVVIAISSISHLNSLISYFQLDKEYIYHGQIAKVKCSNSNGTNCTIVELKTKNSTLVIDDLVVNDDANDAAAAAADDDGDDDDDHGNNNNHYNVVVNDVNDDVDDEDDITDQIN
mmetsp:Transcript_15168/g.17656  ORF Transcript_15168/g.17656 Transcript_15168/m.17656 type:complete len:130 (+) Transcript_15168:69-458(+)